LCPCGHPRDREFDSCIVRYTGIRAQMHSPLLVAWNEVPDYSRRSDRLWCRLDHRFAVEQRERIEITQLVLLWALSFARLFHQGQYRIPRIPSQTGQRMLAFAPYSALAKGIAQKKPVIVRYGIGHANKEWIRRAPSTSVADMHRALK